MARRIKLSKGKYALVSDEDYERVAQFKWSASRESRKGKKWYAIRFYRCPSSGKRIKVRMHRFLLGLDRYERGGLVGDHINGNSLDNRRENLEAVTQEENMERAVGWKGKMGPIEATFREVAEKISDGREMFCCNAIKNMAYSDHALELFESYYKPTEEEKLLDGYDRCLGAWMSDAYSVDQEDDENRVLAMLFMAEIAKEQRL